MSSVDRPLRMPTGDDLRRVSRWSWVLLALGVVYAVVELASTHQEPLNGLVLAVVSTYPFVLAACLKAVAPGQRLVTLSAVGFIMSPTLAVVREIFSADIHDVLRMPLPTYETVAQNVLSVVALLGSFTWLYLLVALLALAFQIGVIRSRRGWWIVAIGLALAAFGGLINVAYLLPFWSDIGLSSETGFEPLRQLASTVLGQLSVVAWGYLLAVALDHRYRLLPLGVGLHLIGRAVSLALFAGLQAFPPSPSADIDALNNATSAISFVIGVTSSLFLIAGVLLELPRNKVRAADVPAAPGAPAASAEAIATGH